MCGIAGYFSKSHVFDETTLRFFTKIQHHRGPDAQNIFIEGNVGFAHNRLSILDTSSNANQPFFSADERYVITYNGEVYNFKELRPSLTTSLRTTSDTEVILELFAKEGKKCVEKFRGMFALAIYDRQEKSLWLMRDRLGIKPLYYYHDKETFVFSSELKAIAELPQIKGKLTIDQEAVCHYLHLGFVPSSATIFKEIKKFPSGNVGELSPDGKLKLWEYWRPEAFVMHKDISHSEAKKTVQELLYQSVEEHLISDVPVGLFLSGGIDSSLLAAISNQIQPGKIKTFTIGFEHSQYDEAPFAKKVAKHIGTEHYEAYLSDDDIIRLLEKMPKAYDEPFADTSAIPTMFVSEMASKHVKVVLSGEGADELFLGYGTHVWADRLDKNVFKMAKPMIQILDSILPNTSKLGKVKQMLSEAGTPFQAGNIYSIEHGFFSVDEIRTLTKNAGYKGFKFPHNSNSLTEQILFEIEIALKDGLLVKMDRASMQYGLEARVPYLDHRLVEFALSINTSKHLNTGVGKNILKEILFDLMPQELFNRKKWGFGIAQNSHLENYLMEQNLPKTKGQHNLQKSFCLFNLPKKALN